MAPQQHIKAREDVLEDLLRLLVKNWGYSTVLLQLNALGNRSSGSNTSQSEGKSERRPHRLSAPEYVQKIDIPDRKREILLELAIKFENREFLPTVGHVKDFLERRNVHINPLRGRSAAIPKIFEILTRLPDENLEKMLCDENYSGPSRLGPLSDAIKARGTVVRSRE